MTFLFEKKKQQQQKKKKKKQKKKNKKKQKNIKVHLAKYSSVPTVLFELQTVAILTEHVSVE